jgi:heme A synthase
VGLKPAAPLFFIMGAVIFLQLLTGGLRVFGFIDESTHISLGFITFFLAIITLVAATLTKPRHRPAISISALLVVLILVQGLLGFAFLNANDSTVGNEIIFVHFANALIIYGLAISGVFMAMRWSKMTVASPPKQP